MSEHVIDTTDGLLGDAVDLRALFGQRLREKIVRCAECGRRDDGWRCMWSGRMVEAEGFCRWGRRRIIS